ncbi:MAG: flagellar basal body-associated FliL family protein [Gemmatimonadaceae bacterium]|nr:flagellar basal body-associated FliL family protein [Gemmatimonadaceae bacterium]
MAEDETPAEDAAPKAKKSLPPFVMPLVMVLAGLGGGGFVGAKVVGPKLTAGFSGGLTAVDLGAHGLKKSGAEGDSTSDKSADDEAHAEGGDATSGGEHGAATAQLYTIADLVLNPAGSGGTRFLMLSVAFDVKDSAAVETLKLRDAEIKDAVLALVGAKTVEQLAEVTAREPLKVEIKDLVQKIMKQKLIKRVSFPQFVIQ